MVVRAVAIQAMGMDGQAMAIQERRAMVARVVAIRAMGMDDQAEAIREHQETNVPAGAIPAGAIPVAAIIGPEAEVARPRVTTGRHSLRPGQHRKADRRRKLDNKADQHRKADRHRKVDNSLAKVPRNRDKSWLL